LDRFRLEGAGGDVDGEATSLVGSEPLSPPDSPLKSFPWMRFVEDIVQEWGKREKRQEAVGKSRFNIISISTQTFGLRRTVTSSMIHTFGLIMSVRIFPPSNEKHEDFEFYLDKFMGKWSVAFSVNFFWKFS
jgi:hypothetical protein